MMDMFMLILVAGSFACMGLLVLWCDRLIRQGK